MNPKVSACYRNLVACAMVDGELAEDEQDILTALGERLGLLPREAREIEAEVIRADAGVELPDRRDDRRILLKTAVAIACADGRIAREERRLIRRLQRRLDVPDEAILTLVPEELRATFRPDDDRERAYRLLAAAARVDGAIDEAEERVLERAARTLAIEPADAEAILEKTKASRQLQLRVPRNPDLRRQAVLLLRSVVLADGRLDPREASLLGRVAREAGVDLSEVAAEEARAIDDATAALGEASIRTISLGVIRHDGAILCQPGADESSQERFFRLPGGGVAFGERARDALAREIVEETGYRVEVGRRLGVLENIFVFEDRPGHEIAFVFEASFVSPEAASGKVVQNLETGVPMHWVPLEELVSDEPPRALYPDGAADVLDDMVREAP